MSLRIFFDPVSEEEIASLGEGSLLDTIEMHTDEKMPSIKESDVAFFIFSEFRKSGSEETNSQGEYIKLRKALYMLKSFSKECKIADLGYLRLGPTQEESYSRLSEVCEKMIEQNTLPVIIGGENDLCFAQYLGYQNLEKIVSVANVDAKIGLNAGKKSNEDAYIHQILTHEPNFLFEYNHLAYQRYYVEPKVIEVFQHLNYEIRSLGQVRDHMQETEPIIRSADLLSFDLSSIKNADLPAVEDNTPFGLTGEEACQICWYAGLNEKLTSVGFYNYLPIKDENEQSAKLISIMLWYFIEGFCQRKEEYSFKSNFHIKYIVPLDVLSKSLVFYKSKLTDKWWMEIGLRDDSEKYYQRNAVVPCSYEDYQTAIKGKIPERWLKATGKQD